MAANGGSYDAQEKEDVEKRYQISQVEHIVLRPDTNVSSLEIIKYEEATMQSTKVKEEAEGCGEELADLVALVNAGERKEKKPRRPRRRTKYVTKKQRERAVKAIILKRLRASKKRAEIVESTSDDDDFVNLPARERTPSRAASKKIKFYSDEDNDNDSDEDWEWFSTPPASPAPKPKSPNPKPTSPAAVKSRRKMKIVTLDWC